MNYEKDNYWIILFIRMHKKDAKKIYWFLNKVLLLKLYAPDSKIFCKINNILQKKNVQSILQKENLLTSNEIFIIDSFINKHLILSVDCI
jgi:hypothetical protein